MEGRKAHREHWKYFNTTLPPSQDALFTFQATRFTFWYARRLLSLVTSAYLLSPILYLYLYLGSPCSPRAQPKSPNAFLLFRSYFISHPYLLPPDLTHQKDVSRYVAWVWNELPDHKRAEWYQKAREEKERRESRYNATTTALSHSHMSEPHSSVSIF